MSGISKVIEVLGKGNVDGVYHLVKEAAEKRDDVCVDGCVYTKVGRSSKREVTNILSRIRSLGVNTALQNRPLWKLRRQHSPFPINR